MSVWSGPKSELADVAGHVLTSWTAAADTGTTGPDLGPVVLATLLPDSPLTRDAMTAWLRAATRCGGGLGLFGGTSGLLAGLGLIACRLPDAAPAADRAGAFVADAVSPWHDSDVGFTDYDLVGGAAGVVLAQLVGALPVRPDRLAPAVAHLVGLAADPAGFRIGTHADRWARGGVVTGLAHGVAGPLAALSLAARHASAVTDAVHDLASWLADHRFTGADGVVSWPRCVPAREPATDGSRRQGWGYGTSGIAWALWLAGRALVHSRHDGQPSCQLAVSAMRTLCAGYDPDHHVDEDRFAVCHGAAGVLLVADAFARHAGLAPAAILRDELVRYLTDRLDDVMRLDASLLTGATGVLAALLTAAGGDRAWLRCLAMY